MKTKLVTSYYPYHSGEPFWGQGNRENWYKNSLANISNMGEIVCYTDHGDKGYNDLIQIKEDYNLDNLTIKLYDLKDNPYQERVYKIRTDRASEYNNPDNMGTYFRSTVIYWIKFMFLEMEYEPNINMYWIDCGLSHDGLFPPDASKYFGEEIDTYYKKHHYNKAFNPEVLERINNYAEGKIINVHRPQTDENIGNFNSWLNLDIDYENIFPVGGFFGGNSELMPEYVSRCKETIERVLEKNQVCSDQEILAYVNATNRHWFKNWKFETFCHEGWTHIWQPEWISFSHFFLKPLQ